MSEQQKKDRERAEKLLDSLTGDREYKIALLMVALTEAEIDGITSSREAIADAMDRRCSHV